MDPMSYYYITLYNIRPIRKIQTKLSVVNTVPESD
jgi:hypothetical protein